MKVSTRIWLAALFFHFLTVLLITSGDSTAARSFAVVFCMLTSLTSRAAGICIGEGN